MTRTQDLVRRLCGTLDHPLAPLLSGWCGGSRPFAAFAGAHEAKIRKKVRLARTGDELADLTAELAVAAFLVRDPRFAAVYEPGRVPGERSPDLGVVFKVHSPFHAEVTRLRAPGPAEAEAAPPEARLARVLGDKIGQCPPGAPTLLVVVLPPGAPRDGLVPAAVRLLDGAPGREVGPAPSDSAPPGSAPPDWRREAARAFQRRRPRLSAVLLCSLTPGGDLAEGRFWPNPGARHPLHPEVVRALTRTG